MADQNVLWNASCVAAFMICVVLQAPFYWPIQHISTLHDESKGKTSTCGKFPKVAYSYIFRSFFTVLLEAFLLLRFPPILLFPLLITANISIVIIQDVLEYTYPPRICAQMPRIRLLISLTAFSAAWFLPFLRFDIPEPRPFDVLLQDHMSILFCCLCVIGVYLLRRSAFSTRQSDRFEAYVRESVVVLLCPALLFSVNCACSYALSNGLYCAYSVWSQQDAISRNKNYSVEIVASVVIIAVQMLLKLATFNMKSSNLISQSKYVKRPSTEIKDTPEFTQSASIPVCHLSPNMETVELDENANSNSSENIRKQPIRERYTQQSELPSVVSHKPQPQTAAGDIPKGAASTEHKMSENVKASNVDVTTIKAIISDSTKLQLLPNPIRYVALSLIESLFLFFTCFGILDGTSTLADSSRTRFWIIAGSSLCGLTGLLSRSFLLPIVQSSGLPLRRPASMKKGEHDTQSSQENNSVTDGQTMKIISTDDGAEMTNIELEKADTSDSGAVNHNEAFPLNENVLPPRSNEKLWKTALQGVRTTDPSLTRILSDLSDEDERERTIQGHRDDTNAQNLKLFDANTASDMIQTHEQPDSHTSSLVNYMRRFERNKTKADKKAWVDPFADLDNSPV